MPVSIAFLKQLEKVEPSLRQLFIAFLEELERQREESVSKKEFNELKQIVKELSENINSLTKKINELVEAQRKTEERVDKLEIALNKLAEAQRKTEERVDRLEIALNKLIEAQRKTEERVDKLEIALNKLAEAQRRTEEEIAKLTKRMQIFEERLEGISNSVGYSLEDRAYKSLPKLLKDRFGIEIEGRLVRRYVCINGKNIQINIYGYGKKDGKSILILGECKVRPSKKEIERFEKYALKISKKENKDPFLLFVAYDFPPKIENLLKEKNIPYFWSYEFEF